MTSERANTPLSGERDDVNVRQVLPADAPAPATFIERLSPTSRQARFVFGVLPQATARGLVERSVGVVAAASVVFRRLWGGESRLDPLRAPISVGGRMNARRLDSPTVLGALRYAAATCHVRPADLTTVEYQTVRGVPTDRATMPSAFAISILFGSWERACELTQNRVDEAALRRTAAAGLARE